MQFGCLYNLSEGRFFLCAVSCGEFSEAPGAPMGEGRSIISETCPGSLCVTPLSGSAEPLSSMYILLPHITQKMNPLSRKLKGKDFYQVSMTISWVHLLPGCPVCWSLGAAHAPSSSYYPQPHHCSLPVPDTIP